MRREEEEQKKSHQHWWGSLRHIFPSLFLAHNKSQFIHSTTRFRLLLLLFPLFFLSFSRDEDARLLFTIIVLIKKWSLICWANDGGMEGRTSFKPLNTHPYFVVSTNF